ncbi:FLJ37770-like protein [Trichonephila clavipes]|nr:FLJ37770-like protein [Trichonephila clavipes]
MIRTILHKDLVKTKVCVKFVPRILTSEEKAMRSAHYADIISAAENDANFLKSIVTGDEFWCFQYDSETMRQIAEWKLQNSPQTKK